MIQVLLALLAVSAQAQTPPPCAQRFSRLCEALAADPRVVLSSSASGALLLNPGRAGVEFFKNPTIASRAASGINVPNFLHAQRPLFHALRAIVAAHVAALPQGSWDRNKLEKELSVLEIQVVDRPRCQDLRRPFVASFDGLHVNICPWMTHLAPETLLTVLSHELGHFVDPCAGLTSGPAHNVSVPGFPSGRTLDCGTNDEDYADAAGAVIAAEALRSGAASLGFPTDPQQRAGALLFYALQPQCQTVGNGRLTPFFGQAEIQGFLGCSGP